MKIPADQVYRTWAGSPALGAASQSYGLNAVNLASWNQEDTLGKSEMMILSKSLMKPSTNRCSQLNIAPSTLFSIWQITIPSKWVILKLSSLWNDIWLSLRKERQRPQSFWNALWLSFWNDWYCSVFVSIWYMTVISIWRRKNFGHETSPRRFRDQIYDYSSKA